MHLGSGQRPRRSRASNRRSPTMHLRSRAMYCDSRAMHLRSGEMHFCSVTMYLRSATMHLCSERLFRLRADAPDHRKSVTERRNDGFDQIGRSVVDKEDPAT